MKKAAFIILIFTIVSKIFGFGRELTLSYFYGVSNTCDAYLISTNIPAVIFGFIAAGLAAGYIPMYTKIQQENGEIEANKFTNNLINLVFLICTFILIFGLIYTKQIVKIFALGFNEETLALTVKFTKISLFAIYVTGIVSIYSGFLQIKKNFIIPALVGIPLNIIIIISIILSHKINIMLLSIGFLISLVSQIFLMIPFLRKNKYRYKLELNFTDNNIRKMAYIAAPVILGVSVNEINIIVDRTLASRIAVGGISALNYADKLNIFIQGIFVLSIVTALYPTISKMAVDNNISGLKKAISKSINGINILVLPATIGCMIIATPIVSFLFGRGAFDSNAIAMTSSALVYYSLGMIGFGLREVLTRTFYSMQDTKTPMINAVIGIIINIILSIILSKYMGIGGLALATSIAAILTTVLLFVSLRKKIGSFNMKDITISFFKMLIASVFMGITVKIIFMYLSNSLSQNFALIISIAIGVLIYGLVIYFMKINDVNEVLIEIKEKFIRKKSKNIKNN